VLGDLELLLVADLLFKLPFTMGRGYACGEKRRRKLTKGKDFLVEMG